MKKPSYLALSVVASLCVCAAPRSALAGEADLALIERLMAGDMTNGAIFQHTPRNIDPFGYKVHIGLPTNLRGAVLQTQAIALFEQLIPLTKSQGIPFKIFASFDHYQTRNKRR